MLGLVTAYNADTGAPPAPDTDVLFKAARQYPHRIFVLDWVKYSRPHHAAEPTPGAWFLPDLFHPNFTGADAYAQFLAEALPLARQGAFPSGFFGFFGGGEPPMGSASSAGGRTPSRR